MQARLTLLADENMPAVEAMFGDFAEVHRFHGRQLQPADLRNVDVLLVRSITQVNAELLQYADKLQFVGTATIGTDHIDQRFLENRGIRFSSAPGCNADAVVDYVLSAIWNHSADRGRDPRELTYGVIGCGNVGGRLVARLEAAGLSVLKSDPPRKQQESSFSDTPLDDLLQRSDVICCHTPLTQDQHATYHLLNSQNLAQLTAGALLINAGRGPVIDNLALLKCLNARSDLDVVLDVWEHEPEVDLELMARAYLVSPHIAGYSLDGKIRGSWMLLQSLSKHLELEIKAVFEDFLPPAPVDKVSVTEGFSPVQAMGLVYDLWRDDREMRNVLSSDNTERAASFDQLRKHYPVRREFSTLGIAGLEGEQGAFFEALGFKTVTEGV